ncbi:HV348 protein, partial [Halcyon senegalensis]|nr:HV348 protein [Halcyon senegalensis]
AVELVESGGGLQPPGGSLRLLCKASGSPSNSTGMNWVRQAPGKGLEWLAGLGRSGAATYAPAVEGRCALTGDDARGQVGLRLAGVMADDSATYYC